MKARFIAVMLVLFVMTGLLTADPVELGGLRSTPPKGWVAEKASSEMRLAQFKLPKAEGDSDDAELVIFFFRNGSGSEEDNLARQLKTFEPAEGKEKIETKVSKTKLADKDCTMQDLSGVYLSKSAPFDPKAKVTKKVDYRQLYVIFKNDGGEFYFRLVGPAKTIAKHEKDFLEFLKNFK
jgi:hypothetical protein